MLHTNVDEIGSQSDHNMFFLWIECVKCGKILEVTPGTPDIKSGPMRCQKDFGFSLCAAPLSDSCPKILEQEGQKIRDQRLEGGLEMFSE